MKVKQKKTLAFLLSAVLILSLGSTAFAEEPSGEGSIEEITQYGTVTGDNISVAGSTLDWVAAENSIGRYQDGWWVGVKIIAPDFVTEANVAKVKYSNDGTDTLTKEFGTNNDGKTGDGKYYMGCWTPIKPESLETALARNSSLQWTYKFDWDGDNTVDQTFTITVDPSNITLMQNNAVSCKTENGVMTVKDGKDVVATVGGKGYESLQEAINAADDNTVRLLKTLTINAKLSVNGNVTLDLGGKELISTFNDYAISVGENAVLTIKNGTLKNTAAGGVTITKNSSVIVENTATIVANGSVLRSSSEGGSKFYVYGNLECEKDNSAAILSNGAKNVVYVDGANIKSQHFGVYQNGSYGGATITVKNSEVTDTKGYGVYVSNSAANVGTADQGMQTLVIENSVITGPTAAEVKYTNVTIKGENTKLIATGTPASENLNNNGGVTTGYALAVTHNGTADSKDSAAGTVIITDGQFTGLIGIQGPSDGTTTTASIAISGGTFTSPVPDEFCAPGYHPEELENGGYGVSDYYHTGTTGSGLVSGGVVIGTGTNTGAVTDPSLLPPQTGDAGSVGIVGALLLLASCGMAGIALRRSAKKREMN